jgi:hypothetical protein
MEMKQGPDAGPHREPGAVRDQRCPSAYHGRERGEHQDAEASPARDDPKPLSRPPVKMSSSAYCTGTGSARGGGRMSTPKPAMRRATVARMCVSRHPPSGRLCRRPTVVDVALLREEERAVEGARPPSTWREIILTSFLLGRFVQQQLAEHVKRII